MKNQALSRNKSAVSARSSSTPRTVRRPKPALACSIGALVTCALLPNAVHAATVTWTTSTSSLLDGGGTWDAVTQEWTATGTSAAVWSPGNTAVFGAGTGGSYTVNLSGSSNVGGLTFNSQPGGGYVLSGGTIALGAVTTTFTVNNATTIGSAIQGTNALALAGTSTLILSGSNNFSGATTMGSGTLQLGNANAVLNSTVTVTGTNALAFSSGIGSFNVGALASATGVLIALTDVSTQPIALVVGGNNATTTFGGGLTGSGTLVKVGTGTLYLDQNTPSNGVAASTYSGGTVIKAGTLEFGTHNNNSITNLLGSGTITLGDTAGSANATILSQYGSYGLSNPIVVQSGNTGTATIQNNGGTLTINGSITLGSPNSAGHGVALSGVSSGNLSISGTIQDPVGMTPGTAGTVTVNTPYNVTFNVANTYTGDTRIMAGSKLTLSNASALGASTLDTQSGSAGTLSFGSLTSGTFGGLKGSNNLALLNSSVAAVALTAGGNNQSTVFSGALSGTGSTLNKIGTGTLTLSGSNTYTGATTVTAGALTLDYSTQDNSKLSDTAALTLSGGTLNLNGGTHTEVVGSTTLSAVRTSFITRGSGSAVLQMGTITRNTGAAIDLGASNIATTNNTNVNGILGNWATVNGTDWAVNATNAAGGAIIALPSYTASLAGTTVPGASADVDFQASNAAGWNTQSINTLRFNTATAATLTLNSAQTLTVNSGGILVSPGVGNNATGITGGNLQGTAGADLGIVQNNSSSGLTIGSSIQDNGGATGLTKYGSGTLTLTGSNTYTGVTGIFGGVLSTSSLANSGTASGIGQAANAAANLVLAGGTLQYTGVSAATDHGFTLGSGATSAIEVTSAAANLTISGSSAASTGALVKTGAGTLTLTGPNAFTGATTISTGTLQIGTGGAGGTLSSTSIVNNGTLIYYKDLANADAITLPAGGITGSGALSATAGHIFLAGNVNLPSGSQTYTQFGSAAQYYANGIEVVGSNVTLTGTAITMTGDAGTQNHSANLTLDTSAVNGPINLNISLGRSGIWYGLQSGNLIVNSGTGAINVTGAGPAGYWTGWNAGYGAILTGAVNISGNLNSTNGLTINPTVSSTASGILSNVMTLTKNGGATLTLTGANTYSGITTVASGTLQIGAGGTVGSLGSAGVTGASGAVLAFNRSDAIIVSNTMSGSLGVAQNGAGTLTLSGSNSYTGGTAINAGILAITDTNSLPGWSTPGRYSVAAGAGLSVPNSISDTTIGTLLGTGNFVIGSSLGFDTTAGTRVYALDFGSLASGIGLAKTGANSLVLSANNTYTGPTLVGGGILQIGNGGTVGSISSTSKVSLASGAVVSFNRTDNYGGSFFPAISGLGGITLASGTLALTGSNSFSGTTTMTAGSVLQLGNANALQFSTLAATGSNAATFASGVGSFNLGALSSGTGVFIALTDAASQPITLRIGGNNTSTTYSGGLTGSGTLVKVGTGTLILDTKLNSTSAFNTYSGGTYVLSGSLRYGSSSGNYVTNQLGSGTVYLGDTSGSANATLQQIYNSDTLPNNIVVQSGNTGTATILSSGGNDYFSGTITLGSPSSSGKGITFAGGGLRACQEIKFTIKQKYEGEESNSIHHERALEPSSMQPSPDRIF